MENTSVRNPLKFLLVGLRLQVILGFLNSSAHISEKARQHKMLKLLVSNTVINGVCYINCNVMAFPPNSR